MRDLGNLNKLHNVKKTVRVRIRKWLLQTLTENRSNCLSGLDPVLVKLHLLAITTPLKTPWYSFLNRQHMFNLVISKNETITLYLEAQTHTAEFIAYFRECLLDISFLSITLTWLYKGLSRKLIQRVGGVFRDGSMYVIETWLVG